jgi:hypothetical protein
MAVGVQVPPSAPSIKGAMTLSCCSLFFDRLQIDVPMHFIYRTSDMNFKQPIGGEKIHDPLAPATGVLSYSLLLAKQLLSWFTVKKLLEMPREFYASLLPTIHFCLRSWALVVHQKH